MDLLSPVRHLINSAESILYSLFENYDFKENQRYWLICCETWKCIFFHQCIRTCVPAWDAKQSGGVMGVGHKRQMSNWFDIFPFYSRGCQLAMLDVLLNCDSVIWINCPTVHLMKIFNLSMLKSWISFCNEREMRKFRQAYIYFQLRSMIYCFHFH